MAAYRELVEGAASGLRQSRPRPDGFLAPAGSPSCRRDSCGIATGSTNSRSSWASPRMPPSSSTGEASRRSARCSRRSIAGPPTRIGPCRTSRPRRKLPSPGDLVIDGRSFLGAVERGPRSAGELALSRGTGRDQEPRRRGKRPRPGGPRRPARAASPTPGSDISSRRDGLMRGKSEARARHQPQGYRVRAMIAPPADGGAREGLGP